MKNNYQTLKFLCLGFLIALLNTQHMSSIKKYMQYNNAYRASVFFNIQNKDRLFVPQDLMELIE